MKENLNKIIITILVIEIITLLFLDKILLLGGSFITFWGIAIILINISAVVLLLKYKPKLYQLTSVICLLVFMLPIAAFLILASGMGC